MGKRITLTKEDIHLIIVALNHLHNSSIINPDVYPKYAVASKQRIEQIERKLSAQPKDTPGAKNE